MNSTVTDAELADYLLSAEAIRDRCKSIYRRVKAGEGLAFSLNRSRLDAVADYVFAVIKEEYPDFRVPYHSRWRHIYVGNEARLADVFTSGISALERGRISYDLVIPSILLDAGSGPGWKFQEGSEVYARSEGLAVASVHMFKAGLFSAKRQPVSDAAGLMALDAEAVAGGMQVSASNPLVGLEGRLGLLNSLGQVLRARPDVFGSDGRLGNLFDYMVAKAPNGVIKAKDVLSQVLRIFGKIWPGRSELAGVNLGDTWQHPLVEGARHDDRSVPFHKLSQWLTYSLLEPLEEFGIKVTDLDDLTGLPEYRNGGLLLDLGLIVLKDPTASGRSHLAGDPLVVEWRALTVCLLDELAVRINELLPKEAKRLSLAEVLQGGTWAAGRKIARELRGSPGGPPLNIVSDGTVF